MDCYTGIETAFPQTLWQTMAPWAGASVQPNLRSKMNSKESLRLTMLLV
jgi:hypothetical protein